jgi:hypothetical protein
MIVGVIRIIVLSLLGFFFGLIMAMAFGVLP